MPPGRWEEAMARDQCMCQARPRGWESGTVCQGRIVVHHIKPKGMGGSTPAIHDMSNLVCLCDRHHVEVHAQPTLAYDCDLLRRKLI